MININSNQPKICGHTLNRISQKKAAQKAAQETILSGSDKALEAYGNYGRLLISKRKNKTAEKPEIPKDAFFIRMKGYRKNEAWAEEIIELTQMITSLIEEDADFNEILEATADGIQKIYDSADFGAPKNKNLGFIIYENNRGCEYTKEYLKWLNGLDILEGKSPRSNEEYLRANVCRIMKLRPDTNGYYKIIVERGNGAPRNLQLAKKEFEKLRSIKNPTDEEINRSAATIQWLIAQESPYERGNDSIANVLTKAIYLAYGMKISPIKEGKSFDFEAFYSDLDDYIEKYPNLFEIPPHRE